MSKEHEIIGEYIARKFKCSKIRQEISYHDIMAYAYKKAKVPKEHRNEFLLQSSKRIRADWAVLDHDIAFEIDGDQHFHPVQFGGVSQEEAEQNYMTQVFIDRKKRSCLVEVGWSLIRIKFIKGRIIDYSEFIDLIEREKGIS